MISTVPGEIERGAVDYIDQIGDAVYHRLTFTKPVGVIEVWKITSGQSRVAVYQRLYDLGVDLISYVAFSS